MISDDLVRKIGHSNKEHAALALGTWAFGRKDWGKQEDEDSRNAMARAWELGLRHWDTAAVYGSGHSEKLCGHFLRGKRDQVYLATKAFPEQRPEKMIASLHQSLKHLQTDFVDLFYLHWPVKGVDLRANMEALEKERTRGTIGHIGVSNFSVEEMEQVSEVGTIDVHQLAYSLYWRKAEKAIIPYCQAHGIAVVGYSSIAMGILTGKFPVKPTFPKGDCRPRIVFFQETAWPHLYTATEQLKAIAARYQRPLHHLAIQWAIQQKGITSALVGARNRTQVEENVAALANPIAEQDLRMITAISDEAVQHLPNEDNIFSYYPSVV